MNNTYVLFCISIIISSLSYLYIEQPFRGKRGSKFITRKKVFSYSMLSLLILAFFSSYGLFNRGVENRFSEKIIEFDKARIPDTSFVDCDGIPKSKDWCILGNKDKKPTTLLFGDSHLLSWAHAIEEIYIKKDEGAVMGVLSACPAFFNIIYSGNEFRKNDSCTEKRKEVEEFLKKSDNIKNVVIIGTWPSNF